MAIICSSSVEFVLAAICWYKVFADGGSENQTIPKAQASKVDTSPTMLTQ